MNQSVRPPSRVKQLVISVDELLDRLDRYKDLLSFAEKGLEGVVESFLSLGQGRLDHYYHGMLAQDLSWQDHAVETVLEDLINQFEALAECNAVPLAAADINLDSLSLVLCEIGQAVYAYYQDLFPRSEFVVTDITKLRRVGDYVLEFEPV